MSSLLYELYSGDYDITEKRDKKHDELAEKLFAEWDKVQRIFGNEFMDRIQELEGELDDRRGFHYYRAGFSLGVRLMIEALTSTTG